MRIKNMSKSWAQKRYPFLNGTYNSKQLRKYAEYENNRQWQDVFNRLVSLAINIFEWGGDFPETCDQYFFEETLLFNASACIVDSSKVGTFISLPCIPAGAMNMYYEHNHYRAYSLGYSEPFNAITHYNKDIFNKILRNGDTSKLPLNGCVCFDNPQKYPMIETIEIYTNKIVDAMRTIDVLTKRLKVPAIIDTDEDSALAIKTALTDIDNNVLAVFSGSNLASKLAASNSIDTGNSAQAIEAAWNNLNNLWSGIFTALGINNLNTADKRERLLVDEVNSNNDSIDLNVQYRLDQRLHFCENMKAAFGVNITCKIKHENTLLKPSTVTENRGSNGGIYDDPARSVKSS